MILSVICPVLNGEKYITSNILKFFTDSKFEDKELLIIDGGSNDRTIEIVKDWCQKYSNIKLIHNPHKYVPYALNIAIKESNGQFISRLDVHTVYPKNYFEKCIELSKTINADNIGGTIISCGVSICGKAIAHSMSSLFGVGNSTPRIKSYDGYVDSIAFGFWDKQVFDKYGFFDETLIKNQDEDHNYLIIENGGKVYQSSKIKTYYFVREKIIDFIKQMFYYGFYKPLVLVKNISRIKIRHIIPSLFSVYIFTLFFSLNPFWLIPLFLYLLLNILFSIINKENILTKIICIIIFPIMHMSYGIGFILGLINAYKK
jgi:glycosyltransferase involved in cell wall biosynthesis